MQRIRVDLPEPEGPAMTIRSPRMTLRLMSFRTWNSPYHLFMWTTSMATSVSETARSLGARSATAALLIWTSSSSIAGSEPALGVDRIAGHSEAEDPEDEGGEGI